MKVRIIKVMIQTEELMSVQYWKRTQIAEISVGIDNKFPYTILYLGTSVCQVYLRYMSGGGLTQQRNLTPDQRETLHVVQMIP